MLLNCPRTCKLKNVTTQGSLNPETNEVECLECGENIEVSVFAKMSMKSQGDILKKKRRAFVFECKNCKKNVQAETKDAIVVGKECPNGKTGCSLNVTEAMKVAISQRGTYDEEDERSSGDMPSEHEEDTGGA